MISGNTGTSAVKPKKSVKLIVYFSNIGKKIWMKNIHIIMENIISKYYTITIQQKTLIIHRLYTYIIIIVIMNTHTIL